MPKAAAASALAIAKAVNADFIRVNQISHASLAPEGFLEGMAGEILRYRRRIDCSAKIYADISVKHAYHFVDLEEYLRNIERCLVDAVIVTGRVTGEEVDVNTLRFVREKSRLPVFVGSGVNPKNIEKYYGLCDGVIVGTYFKKEGRIDVKRVEELVRLRNRIINSYK